MRATVLAVAALAGVSKSTVSRVFTEPSSVKPATYEKVLNAARELQYRPNAIARAMITKKTGNLAFIIYGKQAPVITNPFYGPILESVVRAAAEVGYSMFIVSDDELPVKSIELILQKQVDGIIFASQPDHEILEYTRENHIPLVLVNHQAHDPGICGIVCDDYGCMALGVSYFVELGHRNIGLISGMFTDFIRQRRYSGFVRALEDKGLSFNADFAESCEPTMESAFEAAVRLFKRGARPSAVFCTNDALAVGAMKAARFCGLRVPVDVSVLGIDDSSFCSLCEPELSSIRFDTERIGKQAVECLLAQLGGQARASPQFTAEARLVVRASTSAGKIPEAILSGHGTH